MRYTVATNQDRAFSLLFSIVVGVLFSLGFIATSQKLFHFFSPWIPKAGYPWSEIKEMSFFPLLAGFFAISIPKRRSEMALMSPLKAYKTLLVPVLIAFIFGKILGNHLKWDISDHLIDTLWYVVFIPFGEECLFRGWLYGILDRVWPGKVFTATNPLPVAVWGSAVAFSIWHVQNFGNEHLGLAALQVAYTLVTGLWLGLLRYRTAQIWPGILAHSLINLAAGI